MAHAEKLSSAELCDLAGVTYRQVDYWTRQGALVPVEEAHGSGSKRSWVHEDVGLARVLSILSDLGARADVWRTVCRSLRWHPDLWEKRQSFGVNGRRGARSGYLLDLPAIATEAATALAERAAGASLR